MGMRIVYLPKKKQQVVIAVPALLLYMEWRQILLCTKEGSTNGNAGGAKIKINNPRKILVVNQ